MVKRRDTTKAPLPNIPPPNLRPLAAKPLSKPQPQSRLTTKEIMARECERCGSRGYADWGVCALGGKNVHIVCRACDVLLNEMVVRWAYGKTKEAELASYRKKVLGS
jgi:hypothetical protein